MTEEQLATERGFASERKNGKARTHFVFVDVLNIVSCFAVVCLHTSFGCVLASENPVMGISGADAGGVHFCGADFLHGQRL
mgnify:CR=1 FL=1